LQTGGIRYGFVSGKSTHANRLDTIRDTFKRFKRDDRHPHGRRPEGGPRAPDAGVPMIVLETALPIKFAETIVEALGQPPHRPPQFEGIESLPKKVHVMPADVAQVKRYIASQCA
jgi:threonine synthase